MDECCEHLLVIDHAREGANKVIGTYRLIRRPAAEKMGRFYSSAEYDIQKMIDYPGEVLELGRSCIAKDARNTATMQMLWRGIALYAYHYNIQVMFGCASLPGVDPEQHAQALSYLYHHHLAPPALRVRALEDRFVEMAQLPHGSYDPRQVMRKLPPLIKAYLRVGAMVGDGAVVDHEFNTTDVFIVMPTSAIAQRYRDRFVAAA